jgi:hypothetical protein
LFTIDNLDNFNGMVQVMVTDMMGRVAYRNQHLDPEKLIIGLENLTSGTYIVQVRDAEGSISRVITIN